MNHTPVRLGPLILLLSVICICLTMLSLLSFSAAAADRRLAEKYADTVRVRYELEAEGQELVAGFQEKLFLSGAVSYSVTAEAMMLPWKRQLDNRYAVVLEKEGCRLRIEVVPSLDESRIVSWIIEKEWAPDTSIDNLWGGN